MNTLPPASDRASHYLLVGNASYDNRGCEAIVRGTVDILTAVTKAPSSFTNAFYGDKDAVRNQSKAEQDPRATHLRLDAYPRKWSRPWAEARLNEKFGFDFPSLHRPLAKPADDACCALEIGGDNYTLDYGFPAHLIAMDRWLMRRGKPVIVWGASIGPFSEHPEQERVMMDHLRSLKAVFVRESATHDYLANQHGLQNVHLFADPAFAMTPQEPADEGVRSLVAEQPIAVNISPLLSAYRGSRRSMPWEMSESSLGPWIAEAAELVLRLRRNSDTPVLLIPHVGSKMPGIDDFGFLRAVYRSCSCVQKGADGISILEAELNAREMKWLISRCRALVAARTHATIAAFSTGVPTISLGYSRKALGINQDVFDTTEFCLKSNELTAASLTSKVQSMLLQESAIRKHLLERGALLRFKAMAAGPKLLELLGSG
jgi:colanic acid/amylovoran biosynthesis protein